MGTHASHRRLSCGTLVLLNALACAAHAQSGYFFSDLHPGSGFESSAIWATSGGIRVGQLHPDPGNPYYSNSFLHGGLWIGVDPQVKVLTPPADFAGSTASAVAGGQVAGYANTSYPAAHAARWDADGSNFVDLNPANCFFSNAYATTGTRQGGSGFVLTPTLNELHAMLWSGSPESALDLNPPGMGRSAVYGMAGDQQVGEAEPLFEEPHAYLWHGAADTGVTLHPPNALASTARHTDGAQQVGNVVYEPGKWHAALWSGSADTFVDLNPAGFVSSEAFSNLGDWQVGFGTLPDGVTHALLWHGSATDYIDLNQFAPLNSTGSFAYDIDTTDGSIVGAATIDGVSHAGVWQVPEPGCLSFVAGIILLGRGRSIRRNRPPRGRHRRRAFQQPASSR
jgi:hypothetical protein